MTSATISLKSLRVSFVGKLGGVNRREAAQLVRQHGGTTVDHRETPADLVVIGADELPLGDDEDLLDEATRQAAAEGKLEIISETQFWQRIGLVEGEQNIRRLYTPAMLAKLLNVSVATVRRWHRRKLIVPVRKVHRLPYFDFQEVATARRLAQLLAAGASPVAIEKKLAELSHYLPEIERPIAQLSVIIEGKQLLLRQDEGLVEPSGQMRIDFDAIESQHEITAEPQQQIISIQEQLEKREVITPEDMIEAAGQLEDERQLEAAAEMYRAALAAGGPAPEVSFQLAEVLYRMGDLTAARERYYNAIELDEDYVEARANLGCVLAETDQPELAIAAFRGALQHHNDYPDVHYHLARLLDDHDRAQDAETHWQSFLALAPDSPWADEARERLAYAPEIMEEYDS